MLFHASRMAHLPVLSGPSALQMPSPQESFSYAHISVHLSYVRIAYNLDQALRARLLSIRRSATDEGHLQACIGGGYRQGEYEGARARVP